MEGGLRRNSSSNMMKAAQVCTPTIRVILQEASTIGMCLMNIWEGRKPKKYLRESYYHRIKCTAATFMTTFMWRRPLNNTILATATHRKPKRVSNGTGTQVRTQMIHKCRIKMVQKSYIMWRDPPWERIEKLEREHYSNLNCLCIQLWSIYTRWPPRTESLLISKPFICVWSLFNSVLAVVQLIRT